MQGIGYTFKAWLSGIFFTPFIYSLLLILLSDFHIPASLGFVIIRLILPYTLLISVWVALAIFATIILTGNSKSPKLYLSLVGFIMPFAGLAMVHYISALMSYSGGYLPALAYAASTLIFIWLFRLDLSNTKSSSTNISKTIKGAAIYGLTV